MSESDLKKFYRIEMNIDVAAISNYHALMEQLLSEKLGLVALMEKDLAEMFADVIDEPEEDEVALLSIYIAPAILVGGMEIAPVDPFVTDSTFPVEDLRDWTATWWRLWDQPLVMQSLDDRLAKLTKGLDGPVDALIEIELVRYGVTRQAVQKIDLTDQIAAITEAAIDEATEAVIEQMKEDNPELFKAPSESPDHLEDS